MECKYMPAYQPAQAKNNNFTDSVIYLNVRKQKQKKTTKKPKTNLCEENLKPVASIIIIASALSRSRHDK